NSNAESEGVKVSELKAEIAMEKAMVRANCLYSSPVVPGKNATGTNTDTRTSEVATTAPVTSLMATEAAACESLCSWLMWRWMFSMTTMASSTTKPVASTMPNKVSVLMEKFSSLIKAKVPMSDTGIATPGISVLRQSWRKSSITSMTKKIASPRVLI